MNEAISLTPTRLPAIALDVADRDPALPPDQWSRVPHREPRPSAPSDVSRGASVGRLLFLAAWLLVTTSCRRAAPAGSDFEPGLDKGPEQYSARIVQTVEQDGASEIIESRIAVSGQMIREDWAEHNEKRALIIRPDLGESYLLFLDKAEFEVRPLDPSAPPTKDITGSAHQGNAGAELTGGGAAAPGVDPIAIESEMSPAATPDNITILILPDAMVDNHPCKASERRAILRDGTTEITRTYRATDLSGLIIRTDSESDGKGGHQRVVTERRDIDLAVPQALFDVPAGFRKKPG